jgi:hypothetical protein
MKAMIVQGINITFDGTDYRLTLAAQASTDAQDGVQEFRAILTSPDPSTFTKAAAMAAVVAAAAALDPPVAVDEVLFPDMTWVAAA